MEMLHALVRHRAQGAAFGLICDPEAAAAAHRAGVGARVDLSLGGRSGVPGDTPFNGDFEVMFLSDGRCRYDGPMMNGMLAELGPVACLRVDDVLVAVSSSKAQMLDRNLYRVAGIEPESDEGACQQEFGAFSCRFRTPSPMRARREGARTHDRRIPPICLEVAWRVAGARALVGNADRAQGLGHRLRNSQAQTLPRRTD